MNVRAVLGLGVLVSIACGGEGATSPPVSTPPAPTGAQGAAGKDAGIQASRAPKAPVALGEYFKIRRAVGVSFSFDEKNVAFMSDQGGRPDVWVEPIGGGAATQVTHVSGFVHSFSFSPKEDLLAFEADTGGDELPHLYLTTSKGDTPRDITADLPPGRRTQFVRWSQDGKKLFYLSSRRDEKFLDAVEYDLANKKETVVWKSEGAIAFAATTSDLQRFAVYETKSDADTDVYVVDRKTPDKRTLLTKHSGDVLFIPQAFSKDGKSLLLTSDETGEFSSAISIDVATQKSTQLLKDSWDVDYVGVSESGKYSFTISNADGVANVVLTDAATHNPVTLPAAPNGGAWSLFANTRSGPYFMGFSRSERYVGAMLESDAAPLTPYVLDLKEGKAIAVTDPMPESLRGRAMVSGKSVRVPSFDGKEVPAFLYSPPGDGPFPAVIDVHGGPTAQSRRDFNRFRQYLVSKGYAVLVPNVRGSTGYGKSWTRLDNLDLGGGPLKDVVACKKYLVERAKVSADKVVVMGGSYGGYMALAAATFVPDEFAANVDYFGVSDLKSLVESFPAYWATGATYIYKKFGDPKNPAHATYQHDRSPIFFTDRITRPLLVVQGDKDARVKRDQSERIVTSLKTRAVPVHYLLLKDEGHGFTKNDSYLAAFAETDRFLDRYIFGDSSVPVD